MVAAEPASGCEGSKIPTGNNPPGLTGFRISPFFGKRLYVFLGINLTGLLTRNYSIQLSTYNYNLNQIEGIAAMNPGVKETFF